MTISSTSTKVKVTVMETVYPPISNQEAVWLQHDPEVEARLRGSDFYMIGGRAEATFRNVAVDADSHVMTLDFFVGDDLVDEVTLNLRQLAGVAAAPHNSYWMEAGDKLIRLWDGPIGEPGSTVLEWFTTEKLIWDRSRGRFGITGFDRYRKAATYDLLYVGIAKIGDSFDRLISRGHKARMEILSNEPQRYPGARVTDEIILFLFSAQPMIMTTFEPDHDFENEDFSGAYDHKRIVADAEKAFVSLLKPQYNVVKFANYPKGADGLHGSDYVRYGYVIGESITFNTAHGQMSGARDPDTGFHTSEADSIFVEGDKVSLLISGIDYPSGAKGSTANDALAD
ncbi:hypothetical protein [Rhizobium laguerreae]|uniref:hypothetical protein n=1 Tax=Rhizobium laguerreae TaxID=1076926 RepID=UPI001A8F5ADD|nr:hypothetical protein [Rhizobium laguerreae]MBN9983073.1 hypothetical protein [Rhizobium laguerreae]MBY3127371.1 hypothetical protein [Rhizobium laguerreae]MBY3250207.1 hypothetical protein [Rhizobium laguerreae]